jgi:MarR family transcriptional regulator, organic hydroperoxide resistance regulator
LYRLSNSFPYLLNRVGVRIGELFSQRLEAYDVTLPMYRVMASLWERPDQRLSDLAEMTKIEVSTLSRLVGTLKRKGLLSRRRLQQNARAVAINLTARGRALTEELIPIAIHFADVAVRSRTPEEVEFIKRALAEAYECLNDLEAEITTLRATTPLKRRRRIEPRATSPGSRDEMRPSRRADR